MKKLIVLSVIFALVAGSVFAADIGATVIGKATLLQNSNEEYPDGTKDGKNLYALGYNKTGFGISRVRLGASGELEDGTIGGWLRYDGGDVAGWGLAWWKPNDFIKLQIGSNPDGEFGLDGIARWGFYQLAGDAGVASESWAFSSAFFGGWGLPGIILSITPTEAFAINLGIPLSTSDFAWEDYAKFTLQAKFNIDGVGTAGLTFIGDTMKDEGDFGKEGTGSYKYTVDKVYFSDTTGSPVYTREEVTKDVFKGSNNDNPEIKVYFGLSAIENLGIDIGIGYKFSDTYAYETPSGTYKKTQTITNNNPLAVGVGVSFNADAFGIKARVLGEFLQSTTSEWSTTVPDDKTYETLTLNDKGYTVIFDVLPYFAINDTFTFYLSAGFKTTTGKQYAENDKDDPLKWKIETSERADFAWHVNPYIHISPSYWSGAFFAGFRLDSTGGYGTDDEGKPAGWFWNGDKGDVRNRIINWSIPIGIVINF
jgi:hypothetical protein